MKHVRHHVISTSHFHRNATDGGCVDRKYSLIKRTDGSDFLIVFFLFFFNVHIFILVKSFVGGSVEKGREVVQARESHLTGSLHALGCVFEFSQQVLGTNKKNKI